jgi:hypothetical protein
MTGKSQFRRRQKDEKSWHRKFMNYAGNRTQWRNGQDKKSVKASQSQCLTWAKYTKHVLALAKESDTATKTIELQSPSQGAMTSAKGEANIQFQKSDASEDTISSFYDVIADEFGRPLLVSIDGTAFSEMRVEDFPPETVLPIRVFRFFSSLDCGKEVWEQELQNMNSGCLTWLPVHLKPGMHSVSGAKYGHWFTVHYLQVYAKHFNSSYIMANEGCCYPAKSFGSTVPASRGTVNGHQLERGYFWFVSPASNSSTSEQHHFDTWGWKHVAREGPFDAKIFMEEWQSEGSSMAARDLQSVLTKLRCRVDVCARGAQAS